MPMLCRVLSHPRLPCPVVAQKEMARLRGLENDHMLYDPTRFKSTAVRQAALEAGGGALPPRTRPTSVRELRRTPSKEFRIACTRSMETLPYGQAQGN